MDTSIAIQQAIDSMLLEPVFTTAFSARAVMVEGLEPVFTPVSLALNPLLSAD